MSDRLGVARYPVKVTPVAGEGLADLKRRVRLLEAEVGHLMTAVRDLKNGIDGGDNRLLASGVMNARNWSLSVAISYAYVQFMLGANLPNVASDNVLIARFQLAEIFQKAAQLGANDAIATRKRLNIRPTDVGAQAAWDGKIL